MPRKPDMPCAECGSLMWRGTGALPAGQATCRECRSKRSSSQGKRVASITSWNCLACGESCERKPTKGQRPKWCDGCRSKGARSRRACDHCGIEYLGSGKRFCSLSCRSKFHAPEPKPLPIKTKHDFRSELRRGYEDRDSDLFFAALVAKAETNGDCWIWPRCTKDGYPVVKWGSSTTGLHRIVLEVKHGAALGSQHAHHICANSACVNPDHLQPVTHRDNIAEMLARQSYLSRIRELEAALAALDPDHPLLQLVAVA